MCLILTVGTEKNLWLPIRTFLSSYAWTTSKCKSIYNCNFSETISSRKYLRDSNAWPLEICWSRSTAKRCRVLESRIVDSSTHFHNTCHHSSVPRFNQGDQIGLIFAQWAIVYFGQVFFFNYRSSQHSVLFFSRVGIEYELIWTKNGLGYILVHFFTNSSGHPGCTYNATVACKRHCGPLSRKRRNNKRTFVCITST
jgi:hypothetical protein